MRRPRHPHPGRRDEPTHALIATARREGGRWAALAAATAALALSPASTPAAPGTAPAASSLAAVTPDTTERVDADTLPTFVGTVRSRQTGETVGGAAVMVPGLERRTTTGPDGTFRFDSLAPGRHEVRVRYLGYTTNPRRVEFRTRHATRAELWLERTVLAVEELRVEVSRPSPDPYAGFKRRQENEMGVFLDRGDIEERNPARTSDLFRTMPGVNVTPSDMGEARVSISRFGRRCHPTVYVDGALTNALPVDLVMPNAIVGIEVYRGASEVPPGFNKPTEGCGTIVIWTRSPGHTPPGMEPDSTG